MPNRGPLADHRPGWRQVAQIDVATATSYTLRHLAARIQTLTVEARQLQQQMTTVLQRYAP